MNPSDTAHLPLNDSDLAHKCSALASKVQRLEDELHDAEVQGGAKALVDAQELIDALQSELAVSERKIRVLQSKISDIRGEDDDDFDAILANSLVRKHHQGGKGNLSARSGMSGASTPSLLPEAGENAADAWEAQLEDSSKRLSDAERNLQKELTDSGLIPKDDAVDSDDEAFD